MSKQFRPTDRQSHRRGLLKVIAGTATSALAVSGLGGSAAAHFEEDLEIDIKPDSDDNRINADSNGYVPVAVLQTETFDPTDEDVRYRFGAPDVVSDGGGARPAHDGHVEDVNGDGNDDLILHFPTGDTDFDRDDEEGRLEWERTDAGEHGLAGTDDVSIVATGR